MKQLGIGGSLLMTAALLTWSAGAFAQTTGGNMGSNHMKSHMGSSHMGSSHMNGSHMNGSHMNGSHMNGSRMNGSHMGANRMGMRAGQTRAITGKVAGLNLTSKTFAVVSGTRHVSVNARNARITFHNKPANIARLQGNPSVHVTGVQVAGRLPFIRASHVTILSGSTSRLAPSHYTRMARPTHPPVAKSGHMMHGKMSRM